MDEYCGIDGDCIHEPKKWVISAWHDYYLIIEDNPDNDFPYTCREHMDCRFVYNCWLEVEQHFEREHEVVMLVLAQ